MAAPLKFPNTDHPPDPRKDISGSPVPLAWGYLETLGMGTERSTDRYFRSAPRGLIIYMKVTLHSRPPRTSYLTWPAPPTQRATLARLTWAQSSSVSAWPPDPPFPRNLGPALPLGEAPDCSWTPASPGACVPAREPHTLPRRLGLYFSKDRLGPNVGWSPWHVADLLSALLSQSRAHGGPSAPTSSCLPGPHAAPQGGCLPPRGLHTVPRREPTVSGLLAQGLQKMQDSW